MEYFMVWWNQITTQVCWWRKGKDEAIDEDGGLFSGARIKETFHLGYRLHHQKLVCILAAPKSTTSPFPFSRKFETSTRPNRGSITEADTHPLRAHPTPPCSSGVSVTGPPPSHSAASSLFPGRASSPVLRCSFGLCIKGIVIFLKKSLACGKSSQTFGCL